MRDFDGAGEPIKLDGAPITSVFHHFNAGNGTRLQMGKHGIPIIGWPIAQPEHHTCLRTCAAYRGLSPQGAGRAMKEVAEYLVEAPHAAESGGERNFSHRHSRFVDELLGKKHALR